MAPHEGNRAVFAPSANHAGRLGPRARRSCSRPVKTGRAGYRWARGGPGQVAGPASVEHLSFRGSLQSGGPSQSRVSPGHRDD